MIYIIVCLSRSLILPTMLLKAFLCAWLLLWQFSQKAPSLQRTTKDATAEQFHKSWCQNENPFYVGPIGGIVLFAQFLDIFKHHYHHQIGPKIAHGCTCCVDIIAILCFLVPWCVCPKLPSNVAKSQNHNHNDFRWSASDHPTHCLGQQ